MNKIALTLMGAALSATAMAQTAETGAGVASTGTGIAATATVATQAVVLGLPIVALVATTAAAESGNDTPSAPATSGTSTTR